MLWGKIEESEKASSRRELNPGHLACAASALPLTYDNQTTTSPYKSLPLYTDWCYILLCFELVTFLNQFFCMLPVALSKNKVWTVSLKKKNWGQLTYRGQ